MGQSRAEVEKAIATVLPHLAELMGRPAVSTAHLRSLAEQTAERRCLITGAGGSLGSALSSLLASQRPRQLTLVDGHENSLFQLQSQLRDCGLQSPSLRFALLDIRNTVGMRKLLDRERPQIVFHLAAYKHVPLAEQWPLPFVEVNVLAGWDLLRLSEESEVERLVYSSTDKAVNPRSVYGATKRAMELAMAAHGFEAMSTSYVCTRLVNVVGARGGVVETFIRQVCEGKPLTLTDVGMTRYWITEEEALLLLLSAAAWPGRRGALMLDLGEPTNVLSVAERLWALLRPQAGPLPFRAIGLRPGEKLCEELTYGHERLEPAKLPGIYQIVSRREARPSLSEMAAWIEWLCLLVEAQRAGETVDALFSFVANFSR